VAEELCQDLYCAPCKEDADCGAPGNLCVPEIGGGGACGVDCTDAPEDCPEGAACEAVAGGLQCRPVSGSCKPAVTPDSVEDVVLGPETTPPPEVVTEGVASDTPVEQQDLPASVGEPQIYDGTSETSGGCAAGPASKSCAVLLLLLLFAVLRPRRA